ncbi:MAG: response regulator [Oscillospiraceae bacterium]|nr:response regulator [Oscillospiraceae bacterium]
MTIICVDDEPLVLDSTVRLCRGLPQKPEVTGFEDAEAALAWLKTNTADIALLDICLRGMDGIMLAARIKELHPDLSVIFLPGYSQYAVDAFAVRASGYLLKPVSAERLAEEIDYVADIRDRMGLKKAGPHILVRTFGEFDLYVDGQLVFFSRSKAKELLAFLVDRQGCSVSRSTVFSALWEDAQYDRAKQKQLDTVIRSLRDTLQEYGAAEIFELKKGILRVIPERFDCDMYRFFEGDPEAVNAYRGEYMSSYSWASLTEAYLDRVNNRTV